jgi:adenosylmethionine-8-amino-7-oxononanoate aminotransferase
MANRHQLQAQDLEHNWHPFTQMQEQRNWGSKVIVEAKGMTLKDADGREYMDAMGGLFTTAVGHGRKEIIDAMQRQGEKLDFVSLFDFFTNEPAIELSKKLAHMTPGDLHYVQYGCSGSDAVEIALKMARQYQRRRGFTNRYKIIARIGSFHGVSMGALSANGVTAFREPFEPLVPGFRHIAPANCYHCPFGRTYPNCDIDCAQALEKQILFEGPETVAAFIAEPVPSAGGVFEPAPEYWPAIQEICRKHDVLLIVDEILDGFGKVGTLFACELYGIEPDILLLAKAITSGYFPLSAVIVKPAIYEAFLGPTNREAFLHGQTFQGHPVGCAAALKNIEIIEDEKLVDNAREVGKYLGEQLQGLLDLDIAANATGVGLLRSLGLTHPAGDGEVHYEAGVKIRERAYELGLICRFQVNSLVMSPPIIMTREDVDRAASILRQTLTEAEKRFF